MSGGGAGGGARLEKEVAPGTSSGTLQAPGRPAGYGKMPVPNNKNVIYDASSPFPASGPASGKAEGKAEGGGRHETADLMGAKTDITPPRSSTKTTERLTGERRKADITQLSYSKRMPKESPIVCNILHGPASSQTPGTGPDGEGWGGGQAVGVVR